MEYKYVPVSKADTYSLIARAKEGDEEAKTLICSQNTGLVKKLALKFVSPEYEAEDLIQIGYIGLLKAVYHFRPEFDVMFSTYAVPMIMGELKRFFRDTGKIKVSRSLKSDIYALKKVQEEFALAGNGAPRISQLAEVMGVSPERILEILEASSAVSGVVSLDNQVVEAEYEACYTQGSPESNIENIMIKEELANLGKRERQVIVLRYFRDMTQQEIAGRLGISQVQVSRIEKRAIESIRKKLAE